jgi:hypothetical protein
MLAGGKLVALQLLVSGRAAGTNFSARTGARAHGACATAGV